MLENIKIEKLIEHKDNPRKDIGDIKELAASIKSKGIMQNLTVIDNKNGTFTVIIGHRRLAAAKLAGIKELPCQVVEMGYKEQIATMLLENMQRVDLNIYEQAKGIQLMFDLGSSIKEISQETGFSESTIRKRRKIMELDEELLKKSMSKNVTFEDFMKLDKIKNLKERNKALQKIGTDDFNFEVNSIIRKQQEKEKQQEIIDDLNKYAKPLTSDKNDLKFAGYLYSSSYKRPDDYESFEYFYNVSNYYVELYRKLSKEEIEENNNNKKIREEEIKEEQKKYRELEEFKNTIEDTVKNFIIEITESQLAKQQNEILKQFVENVLNSNWPNKSEMLKVLGIKTDKKPYEINYEDFKEHSNNRLILAYLYATTDFQSYNYQGEYLKNKELEEFYELLKILGYKISDKETKYLAGECELFK